MLPACCSISRMPCWRVQRGRCRATGGRVGGGSGAGRWVALWGQLLDRLNVVAEAERRGLRPIGPGGYTGGEGDRAAAMAAAGAPDVTGSFITALACGLFALTAYASGVLISQLSTSARSGTALAVQFRPGGPVPTHQRLG